MEDAIDLQKERKLAESNDFEGFEDIPSERTNNALKLKQLINNMQHDDESD